MTSKRPVDEMTSDKVISLFQYIKELNKLKQKSVVHIRDYHYSLSLSDLPDDTDHIVVHYRDRVAEEDYSGSQTLLTVKKPEFDKCPNPPYELREWLEKGWDDCHNDVVTKETIQRAYIVHAAETRGAELSLADLARQYMEPFDDKGDRVASYEEWKLKRDLWAERQKLFEQTRDLFTELYQLCIELERDSATVEFVAANGFILDRNNKNINHPVITRRVGISYDPDENSVSIRDLDVSSELYSVLFQEMTDINLNAISILKEELAREDYHPMDRNSLPDYLKILIHQLSSDSAYAKEAAPEDWDKDNRLLMSFKPCFFMRKRLDGTVMAIDQIIENIEANGYIPDPIVDIVSGGQIEIPDETGVESLEEQLAAVGGESIDILLSKEANKEQLEIARRIERYNAVLVQGPPGTGKTHTIANLMGHFLSQGKSVLVTSQTVKALSVLKEKLTDELQDLCVSLLEDSNVDMERSIDGITAYMSQNTSHELKREMEDLKRSRQNLMDQLAQVRKNIYMLIQQECKKIVLNGEEISPMDAAAFVKAHEDSLSYIPGKVHLYSPLPLSFDELNDLYRSNGDISYEEEQELLYEIPDPSGLPTPEAFEADCERLEEGRRNIERILSEKEWKADFEDDKCITITGEFGPLEIINLNPEAITRLKTYCDQMEQIHSWMIAAAVDGRRGGSYEQKWLTLISQIKDTCAQAEELVIKLFGKNISINPSLDTAGLKVSLEELKHEFAGKGKVSRLTLFLHKSLGDVLNGIMINDRPLSSAEDCEVVLNSLRLHELRSSCGNYWNSLFVNHSMPDFFALDPVEPERIAANMIPMIEKYLHWYQKDYEALRQNLQAIARSSDEIFAISQMDSDSVRTEKILYAVKHRIPAICDVCLEILSVDRIADAMKEVKAVLHMDKRAASSHCARLLQALETCDVTLYRQAYRELEGLYTKYDLQAKRADLLGRLRTLAPQWADAIQKREGIHGQLSMPADIEDAWRWKQYVAIIEDMTRKPYSQYQKESLALSKEYREITAKYAAKSAWYHLLRATEADIDLKQALGGWKQTVKRIGKGTGKNAPMYKAKARELMSRCQAAVPAWIMTISKALESLDPKRNQFDIIIIDEASQSDISSLAILYMGKKLVIVGDDKQVSPMAVGMEIDQMNALKAMYIRNKIPNDHLYDAKSSIYDIAATTFQPLMLREHFRCVPEIIGFSNMLSYDYKIKPLRDAGSSQLLPAVVSYRVDSGSRHGKKTNEKEADTIIALLRACMEQPEYEGKTFGIISLLGDEQVKLIQRNLFEKLEPKEIVKRRILCGNASNFQGDERDVIFLSMVDSNDGEGPIRMQGFGADDAMRKRYNVAASRAKDQLFVVHSLDSANDLKPGDIRKTLIDYAKNPANASYAYEEAEKKTESPFEASVAHWLLARGYQLTYQKKVGAYRLDLVVTDGRKSLAIECDGEQYHSGEAKIREDMERQTILERSGWRFLRIRGSSYYRNPETAMLELEQGLKEYGIRPLCESGNEYDFRPLGEKGNEFGIRPLGESGKEAAPMAQSGSDMDATATRETELLKRVKYAAEMFLFEEEQAREAQQVLAVQEADL